MKDPREDLIIKLGLNPILAHQTLFPHRHAKETESFHHQIILDWHSAKQNVLDLVFRGGGKSTIAEEAIIVLACFQKFHNGVIIGETETRAVERLAAIKHELETNEDIQALFGDLIGSKWQETRIELSNGLLIQAYGRGQSLRGVKHFQWRPDIAFLDDLENEESVRSVEGRRKTLDWFVKTLLPAMTPESRIRMAATPLDRDALALKLAGLFSWFVRKIPISYTDAQTGEERSAWPDQYPLPLVHKMRADYIALGKTDVWQQEYMMEPEDPADKVFKQEMFRIEPQVRAWQPTYAVYDPARTVKTTSAFTGKVVGSWMGNRLIVWESDAQLWLPDEIIADIFKVDERYAPIAIGVEEDGLHEFIMQPLRHAQTQRGVIVPVRALKAPKGKLDFIKSLQPYFKAGEVIFAGDAASHARLIEQLLSFPSGRIDAPNALAYFLKLRPGMPIYEDFSSANIQDDLQVVKRHPLYLVLNASLQCTAAALVQIYEGVFSVLADYLHEGDPGMTLPAIVKEAGAFAAMRFSCVAPPQHFQAYDVIGLRPAARRVPIEVRAGAAPVKGREELRQMLRHTIKGREALRVSTSAAWTLRAFSGGYCRELGHDEATMGPYRVLAEGLESFAATLRSGVDEGDDKTIQYAYTADGRRFISALAEPRR